MGKGECRDGEKKGQGGEQDKMREKGSEGIMEKKWLRMKRRAGIVKRRTD